MNTRRRRTPARHAKLYQLHLQRWQLDLRVHTAAELAEAFHTIDEAAPLTGGERRRVSPKCGVRATFIRVDIERL